MAKDDKRVDPRQRPERERGGERESGPFTKDGEYDSLEAWADEDER